MEKQTINIILVSLLFGSLIIIFYGFYLIYSNDKMIDKVALELELELDKKILNKEEITSEESESANQKLEDNETNDESIGIIMFASGKRVAIYNNPTDNNMKLGVGKIRDNSVLNKSGNSILLGHNDGSFRELKNILIGDIIKIKTRDLLLQYEVVDAYVTSYDDPIPYKSSDEVIVTLITCYPFFYLGNTTKRYVVVARLLD